MQKTLRGKGNHHLWLFRSSGFVVVAKCLQFTTHLLRHYTARRLQSLAQCCSLLHNLDQCIKSHDTKFWTECFPLQHNINPSIEYWSGNTLHADGSPLYSDFDTIWEWCGLYTAVAQIQPMYTVVLHIWERDMLLSSTNELCDQRWQANNRHVQRYMYNNSQNIKSCFWRVGY